MSMSPGRKPRRISSSKQSQWRGEGVYREWAEKDIERRGYLARELVQVGLPLTKPPADQIVLQRKQGNITVMYASGVDPKTGKHIGLPYGPIARLLLVWINTEARTQGSRIHVTSRLTKFMDDVGLQYRSGDKGTTRTMREQIRRLLLSQISFYREEGDGEHETFEQMNVSRRSDAPSARVSWACGHPDDARVLHEKGERCGGCGEAYSDSVANIVTPN